MCLTKVNETCKDTELFEKQPLKKIFFWLFLRLRSITYSAVASVSPCIVFITLLLMTTQ
jgi:hypothetical protein